MRHNAHHLALALGHTLGDLLRRMTLAEWNSWIEFYALEAKTGTTAGRRAPQSAEQQKATVMRALQRVGAQPLVRTQRHS